MPRDRRQTRRKTKRPPRGRQLTDRSLYRFDRACGTGTMVAFNSAVSAGATLAMNNGGLFTLTTPAVAGIHYMALGLAFTASDTSGSSELAALFDQYRLLGVTLEFVPFWNEAFTAGTGGGNGLVAGVINSVLDYDDNAAPTASAAGVQTLQQFRSYRCDPMVQSIITPRFKWAVKPKAAGAVYGGGVFSSYASLDAPWIDWNSSTVEHYGIKFIFEVLNPAAVACNLDFRVRAVYHVECRQVR